MASKRLLKGPGDQEETKQKLGRSFSKTDRSFKLGRGGGRTDKAGRTMRELPAKTRKSLQPVNHSRAVQKLEKISSTKERDPYDLIKDKKMTKPGQLQKIPERLGRTDY